MPHQEQSPDDKRWARSMARARTRVKYWKTQVGRCEAARNRAVEMLEDYAKRMQAMLDRGELGSRKGADGESYPQLRIVYWGEIETGSMSLLCYEIDYGSNERARVGAWGSLRAVWDSSTLPWSERLLAWRRSWSHGGEFGAEDIWLDIRACLKALCSDLELDLDFGVQGFPRPIGDFERQLRVDERAWDDWVAGQGESLSPLSMLPMDSALPEELAPTPEEWIELEQQAKSLLDGVARDMRDEPTRDGDLHEPHEPHEPPEL
jgi:hypothetical protein